MACLTLTTFSFEHNHTQMHTCIHYTHTHSNTQLNVPNQMNAVNMLNWAPRVGFDVWGLRIFSLDLFSNKINVRHTKFRSQIIVTEFCLLLGVLVDFRSFSNIPLEMKEGEGVVP